MNRIEPNKREEKISMITYPGICGSLKIEGENLDKGRPEKAKNFQNSDFESYYLIYF